MLLDRQRLIAKEEDLVVEPELAQLPDAGVVERREVDAEDLCAEGGGDGSDLEGHGRGPPA